LLPPGSPDRLFSALTLLVIGLFVASGIVRTTRWRPRLRAAALIAFAAAVLVALGASVLWWRGGD
jgi:hypothetical protein